MEPANVKFGGGMSGTLLHPLVAGAMLLSLVLILCLPRRYIIAALFLPIFTIPKGQVVVLAGLHFTVARILILTALGRCMTLRKPLRFAGGFNLIDRYFMLCALSLLIIFTLQFMDVQALVKSLGDFVDSVGAYTVLRFLIQDRDDVRRTIKVLAIIAGINGIVMIDEQITGNNLFALLGGVLPEAIRDGKLRSKGIFEVELTAAAFGGTLPLLFVWLWSDGKFRISAFLGFVGITAVTITCRASTAYLAYFAGFFGLCFWPIRNRMRLVRWGIVVMLVSLHLAMHGPVWSLIEKIDLTGSSSSFHRYMLIDNLIRHFSDWWLLGYRYYGSWGWEMWDLSDQYVAYGLIGGLITLVLFINTLSRSFGWLGKARKRISGNRREEWCLWCFSAALFSNVVAYFGISYFDQTAFSWYALLAIISAVTIADTPKADTPVKQTRVWGDALQATMNTADLPGNG